MDLVIQTQPPAGKFSGKADVEAYVHRRCVLPADSTSALFSIYLLAIRLYQVTLLPHALASSHILALSFPNCLL